MTKGKKFDFRVEQDGSQWKAEIIRRVTSKKTTVSKHQGGFATEAEAQAWGENELKLFSKNLETRNKHRNSARKDEQ